MDLKVKCERLNPVCHGCLSVDRKVRRIAGEFLELFHKIRNETQDIVIQGTQLCWECLAFLKKWKLYQMKIQDAQKILLHSLQSYYITNGKTKPNSLSSLKTNYTHDYNTYLIHDQKHINLDIEPLNENFEQSENIVDNKDIENFIHDNVDIKWETEENIDYFNNDSDSYISEEAIEVKTKENIYAFNNKSDNYNSDKEIKVKTDSINTAKNINKSKLKTEETNSINTAKNINNGSSVVSVFLKRKYSVHIATTKRDLSDISLYLKAVCLGKEYDEYIYDDNNICGNRKMPYKCSHCNTRFFYKLDLLRHRIFRHNVKITYPLKCPGCKKAITSEDHLEDHWRTAHTTMIQCTLCTEQKLFRSPGEAKYHLKKMHNKIYTCTKCAQKFGTRDEFFIHYMYIHDGRGTYICDVCNKRFDKRSIIIARIKHHHTPDYCKICNRTYIARKYLMRHNKITHPELIFGKTSKELAYCVECNKQYASERKYKLHLQTSVKHTPRKKKSVPCPDCGKIYSKTHFMRNHYRFAHLKVTKHHCEICNKYFTNGFGLRTHTKRVHNKIPLPKNKICDVCGRGFANNRILINHQRTHTGERPHKCKYCPAAFAQETAMKSHQKTQHKNVNLELGS